MGGDVPKRVEEALFFRLKQRAFVECGEYAKKYAECCRGRILSLAWACREESRELSSCLGKYTSRLPDLKEVWKRAGSRHSMSEKEWNCLLDELLHDG